ncbi:hypothetical protein A9Q84_00950 [Halobacteriovorax marinus]|uniref:Lipoprotein n=1 Tax=Halobacteriovorax marinus TaxID=97084 RepID=A0A1Y5FC13_9BACT|nr:hypothetical protein A9Q84_00950 [Halobacteriovorax marinus]
MLKYLSFILLVSLFSCSTGKLKERFPASLYGEENTVLIKKRQSCQSREERVCYKKFPFSNLKRKWSEVFKYQFLNRQNIIQSKYLACKVDRLISCSNKYGFFEQADKWVKFQRGLNTQASIDSSKNNTLWRGMKRSYSWNSPDFILKQIQLPAVQVKRIWSLLYTMKKTYKTIMSLGSKVAGKTQDVAINLLHGTGIAITPKASAGFGIQANFEAIIHDGKMGFFCAPGLQVETDVGISVTLDVIKTFGCKDNEEYSGKFLSVAAGVSAEMIGLPFSIGGSYSIGMKLRKLLAELAEGKKQGLFNPSELMWEINSIAHLPTAKVMEIFGSKKSAIGALIILKIFAKMSSEKGTESYRELGKKIVEVQSFENSSIQEESLFPIGAILKTTTYKLKNWIEKENPGLSNLIFALDSLSRNINTCDAISGQIGLSFSLSPISVSSSIYHYTKIGEIDVRDLMYLASFAPARLATLSLSKKEFKKFKTTLNRVMKEIPFKEKFATCSQEAGEVLFDDVSNLKTIFE